MTMRYPRRYLKTRRQLAVQSVLSAAILLPPLISRISTVRVVIAVALTGLAIAPAALAYRGLRFLADRERHHAQPTPEMTFVFMLVATYPLAASVFLLILLAEW